MPKRKEPPVSAIESPSASTDSPIVATSAPEATAISPESSKDSTPSSQSSASQKAAERAERWKQLQRRAKKSLETNRKEVYAERRRQAIDPAETARIERKKAEAEFKLAKAEAEEEGDDFERKRAWDWTVEESERWDKRVEKKKKHVEDVAFQDYRQTARKIYKKSLRELKPDLESYAAEKAKLLQSGTLMETEDGEIVAVDEDGHFYANADSLGFVENKPKKEAVDRLVGELKKAEDARMRKRKGRDEEDVTYINDKNKQFNQKLARYYNKYTGEIRDSFERGTMI